MVNAWEQTPPFLDKFGGGEGQKLLPVFYPIPPRPCFHSAPASNTVLEIILAFCMAMHRKNASTGMELGPQHRSGGVVTSCRAGCSTMPERLA